MKEENDLMTNARLPDVEPIPPKAALAELERRGYDRDSAWRYAKAARSHTERASKEWNAWLEVEKALSPPTEK